MRRRESVIGITKGIHDYMLLNEDERSQTLDVLNTQMADDSAIVNSRPVVPVTTESVNMNSGFVIDIVDRLHLQFR